MKTPHIRVVQQDDRQAWGKLWQAYLDFYECELAPEVTEHLWQQLVQEDSQLSAFIVEDSQGELLGFSHCLVHPYTWDIHPCCYLEDLYIAPQARSQGLGRAMIEYVRTFAQARGCTRLYWVTHQENQQAQKLYEKIATRMDMIQYRINL